MAEAEHTAYGIPFPPLGERFEKLEEQLTILTGLWATPAGRPYSFTGTHYRLVDSPALPKPLQKPHPPLIVGGGGAQRAPHLAATFADEFNLAFHPLADTEGQFFRVRAACEAIRPRPATLGLSVAQVVCCGADEAEVVRPAPGLSAVTPASCVPTARRGHPTRWRNACGPSAGAERGPLSPGARSRPSHHIRLIADRVVPQLAEVDRGTPRPPPPAESADLKDDGPARRPEGIRATVSPPTATQLPGVGQASAVSATGVYSVVTAVNVEAIR